MEENWYHKNENTLDDRLENLEGSYSAHRKAAEQIKSSSVRALSLSDNTTVDFESALEASKALGGERAQIYNSIRSIPVRDLDDYKISYVNLIPVESDIRTVQAVCN